LLQIGYPVAIRMVRMKVKDMNVSVAQTVSAREFNQDTAAVKRAADQVPVVITDRGKPTHVLMSIQQYRKLLNSRKVLEVLQMDEEIEFEPIRLDRQLRVNEL
ncbi:MAG: type II toxin-antitoxin system Phd/YefM family antitoxin, partial [Microbacteriaceae bacterium]